MNKIKIFSMLFLFSMLTACGVFQSPQTPPEPIRIVQEAFISKLDSLATVEVKTLPELRMPSYSNADLKCMTDNLYFEARGEGRLGMTAVGYVVMNRADHPKFPSTICGVVYQGEYRKGKPVKHRCQFSWTCDYVKNKVRDKQTYDIAKQVATQVLEREIRNPVRNSIYFHSVKINPKWKKSRLAKIGRHVFFA